MESGRTTAIIEGYKDTRPQWSPAGTAGSRLDDFEVTDRSHVAAMESGRNGREQADVYLVARPTISLAAMESGLDGRKQHDAVPRTARVVDAAMESGRKQAATAHAAFVDEILPQWSPAGSRARGPLGRSGTGDAAMEFGRYGRKQPAEIRHATRDLRAAMESGRDGPDARPAKTVCRTLNISELLRAVPKTSAARRG